MSAVEACEAGRDLRHGALHVAPLPRDAADRALRLLGEELRQVATVLALAVDTSQLPEMALRLVSLSRNIDGTTAGVDADAMMWGVYDTARCQWWPRSFASREDAQSHYDRVRGPGTRAEVRQRPETTNATKEG